MKFNRLKPTYAKSTPRGVEIAVKLSIIRIESNKPILEKYAIKYIRGELIILSTNPDDETLGREGQEIRGCRS